jgi:hypothetical protein
MGFHHVMLTWHFGEEPVEKTMHLSNSIKVYYRYQYTAVSFIGMLKKNTVDCTVCTEHDSRITKSYK